MESVFLKLLLSGLITGAYPFTGNEENIIVQQAYQSFILSDHVTPLHYNVKLKLRKMTEKNNHNRSHSFEGETNTRIHIRHKTQYICLHKLYLFIYNMLTTLINEGNGKIYKPTQHMYNSKTNILFLHFVDELSPGLYTLNMNFVGTQVQNTENFLKISYKKQDTLWLTNFQPNGARQIFPCWDEPAYKATFNISILHHKNYKILSNMPIQDTKDNNNDMMWTHFRTTPVMSTYVVGVVVTNFPSYRMNNANLLNHQVLWCRTHFIEYTNFAQSVSKIVTSYLKINYKSLKKIDKIDYVIIPEFQSISNLHNQEIMSKWGLIFYREKNIIYNKELDPPARKIEVTRSVAHEVAHHWFNNLISPFWWSFLWINNGIARLLTVNAINKILPDFRMLDLFVVQIQRDSLNLDTHFLMEPLIRKIHINTADINSLITSVLYIKAPAIFHMFQHAFSHAVFQRGINKYLNSRQLSFATANDLLAAMQIALNESNYKHKFDIKNMMNNWIMKSHYPVINVTRDSQNNNIIISQKNGNVIDKWCIPITYTTQTELNFKNTIPSYWLTPNDKQITITEIDQFDWIIINLQQTGYYRVNYEFKIWQRIVRYLNSNSYTNIHILNRAQIIDDAFYFAMEKQSNFSIFWELRNYLSRETDYIAWYPMIKAFEYLSTFILFSEVGLEERMHTLLPSLLKKIEYQEKPDENDLTKCLRQEVAKWACALGNSDCRRNAIAKLEWHLADPEKHKILPWWKDWTFCKGLIEAEMSVWIKMKNMYRNEPIGKRNKKILEYLTCSEDSFIVREYLDMISSNNNILALEINDRINLFLRIVAKNAKNFEIFEYILENFDNIKPREVNTVAAIIVILNYGYTEDRNHMKTICYNLLFNILSSTYNISNMLTDPSRILRQLAKSLSKFRKYLKEEQITKTIQFKLANRKKRLEKVKEIMTIDLNKDISKKKKYSETSNDRKNKEKTNDIPKEIETEQFSFIYMEISNILEKVQQVCDKLQLIFYNLVIFSLTVTIANFGKLINPMKLMINYVIRAIQWIMGFIVFFVYLFYVRFESS